MTAAAFLAVAPACMLAQTARTDSLLTLGDSLRKEYRFAEAAALYRSAADAVADSTERLVIDDLTVMAENGERMMDYVCTPEVVARQRFRLDDFFLYYPLTEGSWRQLPCPPDTSAASHGYAKALYAEDGCGRIFFSAPDASGVRNIYVTEYRDSLWSIPALLNEQLTSSSDEIYPMLSSDGKSLYFASDGLYGVGGYDLYVSRLDEKTGEWGVPENMGFPYSSPGNDFLFAETPDGRYVLFASDRSSPPDSVDVYVLEYDSMPLRKKIADPAEMRALATLEPAADPGEDDALDIFSQVPDNADTRRYMEQMARVRSLRDSISLYGASLDAEREKFALSEDEDERDFLTSDILRREAEIPVLQDSLECAVRALQAIELEFLFNGVVIDPDKINAAADKVSVKADTGYIFTERSYGSALEMAFEQPEEVFDYSFMVLPEGRFAEDNTLPGGIVYQIQIFSISSPATLRQLNGLSPVFVSRTSSGRYTYSVGVFRTYGDVLSKLNVVKKAGFRNAFIVAFKDGSPVSVQNARTMEKNNNM